MEAPQFEKRLAYANKSRQEIGGVFPFTKGKNGGFSAQLDKMVEKGEEILARWRIDPTSVLIAWEAKDLIEGIELGIVKDQWPIYKKSSAKVLEEFEYGMLAANLHVNFIKTLGFESNVFFSNPYLTATYLTQIFKKKVWISVDGSTIMKLKAKNLPRSFNPPTKQPKQPSKQQLPPLLQTPIPLPSSPPSIFPCSISSISNVPQEPSIWSPLPNNSNQNQKENSNLAGQQAIKHQPNQQITSKPQHQIQTNKQVDTMQSIKQNEPEYTFLTQPKKDPQILSTSRQDSNQYYQGPMPDNTLQLRNEIKPVQISLPLQQINQLRNQPSKRQELKHQQDPTYQPQSTQKHPQTLPTSHLECFIKQEISTEASKHNPQLTNIFEASLAQQQTSPQILHPQPQLTNLSTGFSQPPQNQRAVSLALHGGFSLTSIKPSVFQQHPFSQTSQTFKQFSFFKTSIFHTQISASIPTTQVQSNIQPQIPFTRDKPNNSLITNNNADQSKEQKIINDYEEISFTQEVIFANNQFRHKLIHRLDRFNQDFIHFFKDSFYPCSGTKTTLQNVLIHYMKDMDQQQEFKTFFFQELYYYLQQKAKRCLLSANNLPKKIIFKDSVIIGYRRNIQ